MIRKQKALGLIEALQRQLLLLTCRLVCLGSDYTIQKLASGFIVSRSGGLFLLSAGHVFDNGRWCLETDIEFEGTNETLTIPLNNVISFKTLSLDTMKSENIELSLAWLDKALLEQEAQKIALRLSGRPIEFTIYQGPLDDEPILGKAEYSYASWNSKEKALYTPSMNSLDREATGETGMTYDGRTTEGWYRFSLAGAHKGHEYYRGASGSPITDTTGKVVSLLLGGHQPTNALYGLPIKDYLYLLDVQLYQSHESDN